jgi:hypothetical protein
VTEFRYLGRILSQDDHDLSACVRNSAPRRNGLPSQGPEARGSVEEIVCEVIPGDREHGLLYGSDTWVVTGRMEELLTS